MKAFELHRPKTIADAVKLLGAKGCGEAGAIGAPAALMNAVLDALAPAGVKHLDMPASPQRVWSAIRQAHEPAAVGHA